MVKASDGSWYCSALLCAVGINEDGEPDIAAIPFETAEILLSLLNSIHNEED